MILKKLFMGRPAARSRRQDRRNRQKLNFPCFSAIDSQAVFCWSNGVKFLPVLRPAILLSCVAVLCGCATAANRRDLYNTTKANGPWHDYERNRLAEADTGLTGTTTTTTTTSTPSRTRSTLRTLSGPAPGESAADQAAALAPPPPAPATAAPPAVPAPAAEPTPAVAAPAAEATPAGAPPAPAPPSP
jgi:hypothetical protein